jgi:multidrug efflux pump subunit AcrA (membrane-fusion protein)
VLRVFRRWPVVVAVVVVVVVGGGATAWALTRSSGSGTATTQVVAAKVATINQTVSTSGTIAAAKEADLDFGASGRVTKIKVKVGDKVTKGQVLATVSNTALAATYDAAKATVSSAKDRVSEDASASSTQLTADKAELTAARSQLSSARTAYRDARLRATIAGTVTSLDLTKGEQVSGSASSGSGSGGNGSNSAAAAAASDDSSSGSDSQVVVQSTKTYIVNATVDDTEVKSVKKGQTVAITPQGATESVTGTVASVSAVPSTSDDVVTFPLVVKVSGHPSGVYAGASATLVITTKHVSNVLEIPTLAITYSGSTASVKVSAGGHTSTRTISAGTSYGLETQVLSGLKSGEKVVVSIPSFGNFRRTGTGTGTGGFGNRTGGFGGGTGGFGGGTGGEGGFGGGGAGAFGGGGSSSGPSGFGGG